MHSPSRVALYYYYFSRAVHSLFGRASSLANGLAHPVPAFFHILFKTLAILVYMFGSLFSASFVNIFIVCVLLLAADFWTVKNVTGRLMVGLRWNNIVEADGRTVWKFESVQEGGLTSTSLDSAVFWGGLFTPAAIWFIFGVGSFFRFNFEWLLLILTALTLSGANIVGYVRCRQDAGSKVAGAISGLVSRTGMNSATQAMISSAAGSAFGFGSV